MKSVSRKLSALVKQSELPYTDRLYEILDSSKNEDYNFYKIIERIRDDALFGDIPYALKIHFICTDCNTVISSTVKQVSLENLEEMLRRTLSTKNGTLTAFNLDFFVYLDELPDNFIEEQYAFSLLFVVT